MTTKYHQDDQFDQFARDQVDQVHYAFNASAWNELSNMLDEVPVQKSSSLFHSWMKWLIGLVLIGGLTWLILPELTSSNVEQATSTEWTQAPEIHSPEIPLDGPTDVIDSDHREGLHSQEESVVSDHPIRTVKIPAKILNLNVNLKKLQVAPPTFPFMDQFEGQDVLDRIERIQEEKRKKYLLW